MDRMRIVGAVVAGLFVLAVWAGVGYAAPRQLSSGAAGRFQVVNPTPDMSRNIMLLDSMTGETWIACDSRDPDGSATTQWCVIPRTGHASVTRQQ